MFLEESTSMLFSSRILKHGVVFLTCFGRISQHAFSLGYVENTSSEALWFVCVFFPHYVQIRVVTRAPGCGFVVISWAKPSNWPRLPPWEGVTPSSMTNPKMALSHVEDRLHRVWSRGSQRQDRLGDASTCKRLLRGSAVWKAIPDSRSFGFPKNHGNFQAPNPSNATPFRLGFGYFFSRSWRLYPLNKI